MVKRQLTPAELAKPYSKYYFREMTPPPKEVYEALKEGPVSPSDALPIQERNELLKPGYLPVERGWCIMPDGTAFVAGLTDMPNVTPEMIAWWFAWHGLEDLRYMIWDPDEHFAVHVRPEDLRRRLDYNLSLTERNWGTTDVVLEDIGTGSVELNIHFMSPLDFGYDPVLYRNAGEPIAVNSNTSSAVFNGVPFVSFTHVVRPTKGGIELRSRFWLGWVIIDKKPVKSSTTMPVELLEKLAQGLAFHCPKEYYNLAAILPDVFAENHNIKDRLEDYVK